MLALVDCNNFFASCERLFRPDLRQRPVAVLSSNDGCVIARSNEVKALGIKMGAPYFKVKDVIEKNNVAIFSTNFKLYGDISTRVMNTIREFSPYIEVYSIDEAFIDLRGFENYHNLREYALDVRKRINTNVGIPTSVGVAPTKSLTKLATNIAKKIPSLNSVHVIDNEDLRVKALKWTPIEDVWGVGRRSVKKLKNLKINSAYDLSIKSQSWVNKLMNKPGVDILKELNGEPAIDMEVNSRSKQSVCVSRTFAQVKTTYEQMELALVDFTSMVAMKLRKQNSVAKQICVFCNNSRFIKNGDFVYDSFVLDLPVSTSSSIELVKYAKEALKKIYKSGVSYKRAGVVVGKISSSSLIQGNLFDNVDREKHNSVMKSVDFINKFYGGKSVQLASESKSFNHSHSALLSPSYTTQWDEIITVNCGEDDD
jgi:DNA polymerase V